MSRIRTTKQAAEIRHGLTIGGFWRSIRAADEHREEYARYTLGGGLVGRAFMRASDWGNPDNEPRREPTQAEAFLAKRAEMNREDPHE